MNPVMQYAECRMQVPAIGRESRRLHFAFCILNFIAAFIAAASVALAAESTLVDAAERSDRATALKLLAKGADVNVPGPDGTTAIMYAAANDDLELVRALIKAGANVKLKNQFGTSALTEAARHRSLRRCSRRAPIRTSRILRVRRH